MKKLWLTYAWKDNQDNDIDYIAQELGESGIEVRRDIWDIATGQRLWEQIEKFITDGNESDGWAIVVTQNSLGSEPCKEELAYALDRSLKTRGAQFPIIGIFPSTVDDSLIPAAIKTRLYVSTAHDEDWKERILAALEGRKPNIQRSEFAPYGFTLHRLPEGGFAIEMRPRSGTWSPFLCAIPLNEKDDVQPQIRRGAKGMVPDVVMLFDVREGTTNDQQWWFTTCGQEATPSMSYYLFCKKLPSRIHFGKDASEHRYTVFYKDNLFK